MRIQKMLSAASSLTSKASIAARASYSIGQRISGARAEIWSAESRPVTRLSASKKLLLIVLSIVAAGLCCGSDSSANSNNPAYTGACGPLPPPSWPNFKTRLDAFVMANCYGVQKQNWPHEANRRSSEGLHSPFVKLWYSPQLYRWMTLRNRQGPIPDGSVVIKEEYDDDVASSPICFWSVMIRDSNLWWDGWSWAVVGIEGACGAASSADTAPSDGCPEPQFSFNGPTAINCIGCHASAISGSSTNAGNPGTGTYSTPEFVTPATEGNVNATLPLILSADPNGSRSPCAIGQWVRSFRLPRERAWCPKQRI